MRALIRLMQQGRHRLVQGSGGGGRSILPHRVAQDVPDFESLAYRPDSYSVPRGRGAVELRGPAPYDMGDAP
jgi:hypothetical protein